MHSISSLNVIDLLLDAVCMVQAGSRIVFVSPAFERIFGYAPAEVVGRRMLGLVPLDDRAITQVAVSKTAHTAKNLESLYERIHQTIGQMLRAAPGVGRRYGA